MFVVREPPPDSPEASHIQNADINELILMGLHIRASYYTMVAGLVVYLWDILLTLKDEQELLWSKGGRFVKLLYLIVSLHSVRKVHAYPVLITINRTVICRLLDCYSLSIVRIFSGGFSVE